MHSPEPVQKNETHKLIWDFEIQTDHLILARQPNLAIVKKKKKNLPKSRFCHPGSPQSKTKRKRNKRKMSRPC